MLKSVTFRTTLLALACAISFSANAMADGQKKVDVPAGDLIVALQKLAEQSGVEFIYSVDQLKPFHTDGVKGDYEPKDAIRLLIKGTPLELRTERSGAILIALPRANALAVPSSSSTATQNTDAKEGKKSSSGEFRSAQLDQGAASQSHEIGSNASALQDSPKSGQLEEIVVTAQKREQRLHDVPVPVTALSADSLVESNQLRLQDYYTEVPGLSVTPADFRGDPILTIRGIASGGAFTNPTVGIVIDDIPYGASSGISGSSGIDIAPSELARVEVLRGPQGTLYGVSSIGGLLKYVTVDPSTDRVSGRVQAGVSGVYGGTQPGYNASAAINVPLGDAWAIRASVSTRRDPGYVFNVETGQRGINEADVGGGRLAALWRPSGSFSLKLSALFQDAKQYGSPLAEPDLGDLKQSNVRGTGTYNKDTQAYSATIKAKLGSVDLTSLSGYSVNEIADSYDLTHNLGPTPFPQYFVVAGTLDREKLQTRKYTQELRLSAPIGQGFEWLLGAFYTHETTPDVTTLLAADPPTGAIAGALLDSDDFPTTFQEYAVFADLTFHVTDRFDVQIGGRESQNRQTYHETLIGIATPTFFGLPSPVIQSELDTKSNSFTYLITPTLKLSPDVIVYARLASGYRAGGPNTTASLLGVTPQYAPDTTRNYEIGTKGALLNNTLSFDASVYYIDWKKMQLQLAAPNGAFYYANASRSKSRGVELSGEAKPLPGLKVAAWVAWNGAVLTKDIPGPSTPVSFLPAYGVSGDRLPYSARFSGTFSVQQDFLLTDRATGFVAGSVSYVGDRKGVFTSTAQRQDLPAYTKTDLRVGAQYDSWTLNVFVDNVTDQRGVLSGGLGTTDPVSFYYIQPRTVGLSVTKVL